MGLFKRAFGFSTIILAMLPQYSMAGSGSAFVPHWDSVSNGTYIYVSNITSNVVEVNFTIYGKDGEEIAPKSYFNIYNNLLGPKSSGYIEVNPEIANRGYAVIEWKNINAEDNNIALIAHAARVTKHSKYQRGDFAIPINSGQPF